MIFMVNISLHGITGQNRSFVYSPLETEEAYFAVSGLCHEKSLNFFCYLSVTTTKLQK